ncbi:hypothetical protein [Lysinibacillus fusiformis]|uniref:hypothetical protein n=1 Tax=Lysinibacillus fusiformis TaxID=28031 RepID=UPI00215B4D0D|nr:hypothetical protein [Lysinibacillus fusiformis]MCR8854847.1 hypothetical protein [Lysinibacillus fusiformis]
MINELLMDNEIYIARKDSHKIKVEEMDPKIEYHPCDDNEGSCIIINGYKYSIVLKKDKLEICVNEDVSPKYWNHEFISAKLWFDSFAKAVERHKLCTSVYKDVDPHQLMSLLFFFDLETKDYNNLRDVIDAADAVITEISEETENFAKRSLIKFFSK